MKVKLMFKLAALFAAVGFSRIAFSDAGGSFTPVENLPPEQRQEVFEKALQLLFKITGIVAAPVAGPSQKEAHSGSRSFAQNYGALRARLPPIFALVFRAASLRYRISCESYSKTMAFLLFGGPHSSQGNWFGLRCSWLLFHLCCRALRTFATEAVGKLAAIIRVNLGVVLGS
jgi:hypothetical protein